MIIHYYHREKNGTEVSAVYSSWEEADKGAEAFLEEHGFAIANISLDLPLWEAWLYLGKHKLAVPPQYIVDVGDFL
jgi:hypothetical protein